MGPKDRPEDGHDDLFRHRLENIIDQRHPLVRLAGRINWSVFETEWGQLFPSTTGRPAAPPRLIAGLLYLQHAYNLSDEAVVERWVESPYFQCFCGEIYFQHELPIDPSSLVRWRKRIGEEGVELLLAETVAVARGSGLVKRQSLERISVDTTVMWKAVTYPTDAKLYARGLRHLVRLAHKHGVRLRQSYVRKAPLALLLVNRYAKARQTRRLKTYLGRVYRDLNRKLGDYPEAVRNAFTEPLGKAWQVLRQARSSKGKLLSWHAPGSRTHWQRETGHPLGVRRQDHDRGDKPREFCGRLLDAARQSLRWTYLAGGPTARCDIDRRRPTAVLRGPGQSW